MLLMLSLERSAVSSLYTCHFGLLKGFLFFVGGNEGMGSSTFDLVVGRMYVFYVSPFVQRFRCCCF